MMSKASEGEVEGRPETSGGGHSDVWKENSMVHSEGTGRFLQ